MAQAKWNDVVIAESEKYEMVEGNVYFPPEAIKKEYFKSSNTTTVCPWKGTCSYYTITAKGQENKDSAWYYPDPKPAASNIKGYVAFWRGVEVSK